MNYNTIQSEVYFLKMITPPPHPQSNIENTNIVHIEKPIDINWYRKLYTEVGEAYNWLDRIFMEDTKLLKKINSPQTHIYTFLVHQSLAGYCELVEEGKHIEMLYFGLLSDFIGKGYGKYFLRKAIDLAWSFNPTQVQLNTCDLDHPNAIRSYKKAGFVHYKTIVEEKKITIAP
ncbi:GNAT family N-acetyltransferase [Saccharicrinis fermentans]|uniref:N-acetyltransferase domain-containing protein n=1 Tax=Saccharicrinis fermentans DSM 9555 = JCM 21142 TaxID=869213 RepID=W7YB32_9BACT|nr:GNAT family N-acetyltransferase [Saccharicrinis fermentans]GAF05617.1 hypothetical protein JCM21142_104359 [Saccharicrinis fermentans DSM 9555 = JCM 21142]